MTRSEQRSKVVRCIRDLGVSNRVGYERMLTAGRKTRSSGGEVFSIIGNSSAIGI
jgi:hypothetical protein